MFRLFVEKISSQLVKQRIRPFVHNRISEATQHASRTSASSLRRCSEPKTFLQPKERAEDSSVESAPFPGFFRAKIMPVLDVNISAVQGVQCCSGCGVERTRDGARMWCKGTHRASLRGLL